MKQDALFSLPVSTWKELLKSDEVKARSEKELYEVMLRFVNTFPVISSHCSPSL